MKEDQDAPLETVWKGEYLAVHKQGRWEFVGRTNDTSAVVILAEFEGKVVLIEQYRMPVGGLCIELPAGLVGDENPNATVEETAVKELEEETGFTADRIEILGEFYSSPGMVAERFTLVRAHGLNRVGEGGGTEHEEISVHLVPRGAIADFITRMRQKGLAIDAKMLLFLDF